MLKQFNATSMTDFLDLLNTYIYKNSDLCPEVDKSDIESKNNQLYLFDQQVNNDKDIIKILKEFINNNK